LQAFFSAHLRKPLISGWLRKDFFSLSQDPSFFPDTPYGTDTLHTCPYTEFALPQLSEKDCASGPQGITVGPDGALWFTDSADKIGHITTQGRITEFALSTLAHPMGITTGPDGALWFTQGWGPLGRITTQGHITLFSPHYTGGPGRIVAGPDGALWMTEVDPHAGLIGRFSPSSARVPESRKVSAATFPCPVVTPIPTAPSTPSPSGSRLCVLRLLLGSTPHASFIHQDDRALMQDRFQFWNDISTGQQ
jgi:hypothetical protein